MADWQKGDLALALYPHSQMGKVFTVSQVVLGGGQVGLCFSDHRPSNHPSGAWCASTFRKVTPPKADEFDREVIDLMAGKKVPA